MQASLRTIATVSLWLALVGSLVEVVIVFVRRTGQPLMVLSPDYVWMAPLVLLTLVAVIVAMLGGLAGLTRHRVVAGAMLFIPATLVVLNILMLVPGLAHYAAALLAAGIAAQMTRVLSGRLDAAHRLVRWSALPLVLVWVVTGAAIRGAMQPDSGARHAGSVAAPTGSPNVILITLDTVRAASLDVYGYGRETMPRLTALAQRGVVFDRAQSTAPWTLPSHASMLTGRWPYELSTGYETALDATYPTLAGYLRDHGYATGGFAANLKYVGAATGLSRGFDAYEDYSRSIGQIASSSTLLRSVASNFRLRRLIRNDQHLDRVPAAVINARALEWISAQAGPFFAFLNYFDAHEPYLPPAPFDRRFGSGRSDGRHSPLHHWLWNPAVGHRRLDDAAKQEEIDAYDGALAWLDAEVGRFLEDLSQRGLLDNTVVVVTSDHGEEFGEHGVYEHGYSLYQFGLHVPLIVVGPGRVPRHVRVDTPVSLRDLAATVVDLVDLAEGAPFPGASLAGLWRGDQTGAAGEPALSPQLSEVVPSPGQPDWFPSSRGRMWALVHGGLKYIRNGDGSEELYDTVQDPVEQRDLATVAERQPDLAAAREALDRLRPRTAR